VKQGTKLGKYDKLIEQRCNVHWVSPLDPVSEQKFFPRVNLIGRDFGRLHVESFAGYKLHPGQRQREWYWWCTCACGKRDENNEPVRVRKVGRHMLVGRTQSCGCLTKELNSVHPLPRIKHHMGGLTEIPWDRCIRMQSARFEQALAEFARKQAALKKKRSRRSGTKLRALPPPIGQTVATERELAAIALC
jgi:hypothetical protein